MNNWDTEAPFAITTCDTNGDIIAMNNKSKDTFASKGDADKLIGKSLFDCHGEKSAAQIKELLKSHSTNCYTIEKNGIKKLIYQCPYYNDGNFAGLVEISLPIPEQMPHFIRS